LGIGVCPIHPQTAALRDHRLAREALSSFLDLLSLALEKEFTVEYESAADAILRHPVTQAQLTVSVRCEALSPRVRKILYEFLNAEENRLQEREGKPVRKTKSQKMRK